jgi:DegV family protein with EDD domain
VGRTGIVTDSTACVPDALARELAIEVIPVYLNVGDQVFKDGAAGPTAEFYEKLRNATHPATTAAPSPGVYADAILRAGEGTDAVICVTVSRQFSAMYDAAVQGAQIVQEQRPDLDVRILDSGAAAMAQGFVVLEAARAARDGADVEEALRRGRAIMPGVQLVVVLDTLAYLARSGRVPKLVIWAAGPLQVKPIVSFQRGVYRPIGVSRTTRGAIERLCNALENRVQGGGPLHLCVHHTNVPDLAERLAERVRDTFAPKELILQEFTQVMGVHTGPGLLGFAFYTEP